MNLSLIKYKEPYKEYIYYLLCPITNYIFYVGKSIYPKYRLYQHVSETIKVTSGEKYRIISSILKANMYPIVVEIDSTEISNSIEKILSAQKEIYWINRYIELGQPLCNKIGIKPTTVKPNKDSIKPIYPIKAIKMTFSKKPVPTYNPFENWRFKLKHAM